MIWLLIIGGAVMLYAMRQFVPVSDDFLYISEETRIYHATGRHPRRCAFVDWSSVEHLDAWTEADRKGN